MRTFDMQGLIGYVSLITCNQSLFDNARDECGFYIQLPPDHTTAKTKN